MTKLRAFIAATVVSLPLLSLDAAQVPMPQGAAPVMSDDSKPTTASGYCCFIYYYGGFWFCVYC